MKRIFTWQCLSRDDFGRYLHNLGISLKAHILPKIALMLPDGRDVIEKRIESSHN